LSINEDPHFADPQNYSYTGNDFHSGAAERMSSNGEETLLNFQQMQF
jgi:hypothetical protein